MATLSYPDLRKRMNNKKFIDKTFGRKGEDGGNNENNWMHKTDGLFFSESIEIGGDLYKKFTPDLYSRLISAETGGKAKIFLKGKGSDGKRVTVKLSDIEKSAEFGGQGSKGNKGHQFEAQLETRLIECLTSRCCTGQYAKESKKLLDLVSKELNSRPTEAKMMGGMNQSRPIKFTSGKPFIAPMRPGDHGEKLTDITVEMSGKQDAYLSLKSGTTLTFINAGVAKEIFLQSEIQNGQVKRPAGLALLNAFGIDNSKFCTVFNSYVKDGPRIGQEEDVTKHVPKSTLSKFMQTAIGANYFMIHELNGKIYYWWVGEKENKEYANISGSSIKVFYGGKKGNGKRIDVEFSNKYYDFKMNIRNKQGGQYPSHIMLDYTSKSAIKKVIL